jgi:hypothetical protein
MRVKIMALPNVTIDELRAMKIGRLMTMVEKMTDVYVQLIKEVPVSKEATQCRELIASIYNIIDEKIGNGEA